MHTPHHLLELCILEMTKPFCASVSQSTEWGFPLTSTPKGYCECLMKTHSWSLAQCLAPDKMLLSEAALKGQMETRK